MELKLSGEAFQTYLMLPSTKVCIRTSTLAEVCIKIHTCIQIPSGFTMEETVEHSSSPQELEQGSLPGDVHSATQLSITCNHGRVQSCFCPNSGKMHLIFNFCHPRCTERELWNFKKGGFVKMSG